MSAIAREEFLFEPTNDRNNHVEIAAVKAQGTDIRSPKLTQEQADYLLARGPYVGRLAAKRKLLAYAESLFITDNEYGPNLPDYVLEDTMKAVFSAEQELADFDAGHVDVSVDQKLSFTKEPYTEPSFDAKENNLDALHVSADTFNLYLQDLGRNSKLLSAAEEVELAKAIEAGLYAEKLLSGEYSSSVEVSIDELEWLAEQGRAAKERFIQSNLRLTVSIAKRFGRLATGSMKLEDMVQEGNLGMMHALEKFDYQKGFKFSTYSTWWIKQAVNRAIDGQSRLIRIPIHRMEQIRKVSAYRANFMKENDREPTREEMFDHFKDFSRDEIQSLFDDSRDVVYLDTPVGQDGEGTLGDMLHDAQITNPAETVIERDRLHRVNQLIDQAITGKDSERKTYILRARHGLIDDRVHKLSEIGRQLGISAERVRQLERSALQDLRNTLDQFDEIESLASNL